MFEIIRSVLGARLTKVSIAPIKFQSEIYTYCLHIWAVMSLTSREICLLASDINIRRQIVKYFVNICSDQSEVELKIVLLHFIRKIRFVCSKDGFRIENTTDWSPISLVERCYLAPNYFVLCTLNFLT